jgi:chromatin remodeling complex protein RSC6
MLTKKHHVTQELADVIGKVTAARGDVTKLVWAYIHKHKLQGCKEGDRRNIYPDECLARVLGKKKIDMLKMTGKVSKHILDEV